MCLPDPIMHDCTCLAVGLFCRNVPVEFGVCKSRSLEIKHLLIHMLCYIYIFLLDITASVVKNVFELSTEGLPNRWIYGSMKSTPALILF